MVEFFFHCDQCHTPQSYEAQTPAEIAKLQEYLWFPRLCEACMQGLNWSYCDE